MIKVLIFDWGNTVMRDFPDSTGPMYKWNKIELIPDVEKQLKILTKKYYLCIASNAGESDTSMMIKALKIGRIDNYFDCFFTSKDLRVEKPDIRFFELICKHIACNPYECIMVGNDYNKDIVGAKDAGMFTILYNEKKLIENYIKADFIIYNMSSLVSAIKFIVKNLVV